MRPGDGEIATPGERGAGRLIAGRYLLLDRLGRGGMGTVWRARDQVLEREIAVKELHIFTDGGEEHRRLLRRAVREARTVARVPHPHVVGVHDLVEHEDRLWIVMELIDGPSLVRLLADDGPLPPRRAAALGLQLLGALEAVHAAGALHRDVKPANVLLRRDGSAVLTDFGIAILDDGEFLTTTGELVGSADFMAPERLNGDEVGPASDLWSLAATLCVITSGESPFGRPSRVATLHAVAFGEPVIPERVGPLRPVMEALLRKAPEERPSAATVRDALRRVADGAADPGPPPPAVGLPPDARPLPDAQPLPAAPPETVRASSLIADAETRTHAGGTGSWAGGWEPTAAGTSPLPDPRATTWATVRDDGRGRSRGSRKRTWWAVAAGAVVLTAGLATGLFVTGTPPFGRDDAPLGPTTTKSKMTVRAATGWQRAAVTPIRKGDRVTVRYTRGTWTVDYRQRQLPYVGARGLSAADDQALEFARDCKVNSGARFGTLLGRFSGNAKRLPGHIVAPEWHFRAARSGTLELRINDGDDCLEDNKGTLGVTVSVTH
ncbi:serine/threonine-protein kinase [Streptomyces sp. ME19-01-6]|uniref:serine/threonine-protein kinase n=1 Tax=Streptomyces sp. ME19-01-6 TaxID=3028686 RepID=UPI0029BB2AB6|nr:serine/threonine-protein kinase [Streptomyces sp. ME19-01-6]MDX3226301.1 serine/threonine-protein kinase [Streptomyces sp. ME19-01-6]